VPFQTLSRLTTFERRTVIYNVVCDIQGECALGAQIDTATARTKIRQLIPDLTNEEFGRALKTFYRVSSVMRARAEQGDDVFTPEVKAEIDAIIDAYVSGDGLLEH
jgi:hypothetical protein